MLPYYLIKGDKDPHLVSDNGEEFRNSMLDSYTICDSVLIAFPQKI